MNLTAVCPGGNPFHSLGLTIKAKFFLLKKKKKHPEEEEEERQVEGAFSAPCLFHGEDGCLCGCWGMCPTGVASPWSGPPCPALPRQVGAINDLIFQCRIQSQLFV